MPRSASRDLADRYLGNRGYFRRPDAVRRAKVALALVALGLSVGWAVLDTTNPPRAAYSHTHGPLADPHAAWDNNCEACHQPFGTSAASSSVFRARERWHDLTCEKCHSGPAHHAAVTTSGAAFHNQCSNCHHDHGGRGNSLVRISDSHCTKCHENLAANHAAGESEFESRVTVFDKHPEFGLLRSHPPGVTGPRGLKFSHSVHMTPGLVLGRGGGALTPATMKLRFGDDAERYRTPGQGDDSPIQMTCAMCHQLDAGLPATTGPTDGGKAFDVLRAALKDQPLKSILPARAEGAYYLPVNFDAHCKTCHPIHAPAGTSGTMPIASFPLPHRKQPAELKTLLSAEYARKLTFGDSRGAAAKSGRLDPRTPAEAATYRGEIDRLTDSAMNLLFQGLTPKPKDGEPAATGGFACGKCHVADDRTAKDGHPNVGPTNTRTVWFQNAKFNHVSHRGMTCAECHPGTESRVAENGDTEWTDFEPIRIRGVKSCQVCHAPAGRKVEMADGLVTGGGVRHGCTDCHKYHNGDHALGGRGATARDPLRPRTVSEFLRGK